MITLSDNDRNRFATWLEQEAHSLDSTAEQMKKIKGLEIMIRKFKAEAAAHSIVASKLRSTETSTIS